jgi:protein involved in sex pheromone biosynthesis
MLSTPKFAHVDTRKPDGFYVQFERVDHLDEDASPNDYLFQDEDYREQDQARLDSWLAGDWSFIGIRAKAKCMIVRGGVGTLVTLESPGLWGTESDSDPAYLESIYEDEKAELLAMIAAMQNPIVES